MSIIFGRKLLPDPVNSKKIGCGSLKPLIFKCKFIHSVTLLKTNLIFLSLFKSFSSSNCEKSIFYMYTYF